MAANQLELDQCYDCGYDIPSTVSASYSDDGACCLPCELWRDDNPTAYESMQRRPNALPLGGSQIFFAEYVA